MKLNHFEKVSTGKLRKFCNKTCSASYNNKIKTKRKVFSIESKNICNVCGNEINLKQYKKRYIYRKRCNSCKYIKLNESLIDNLTKESLFKKRKNWQSARGSIRRRAYAIYRLNNKPKKCIVCGYDKTYQVIHLKSVSSFPGTALISEINDIKNLEALCLNCHWEYDNGLLDINPYVLK